MNKAYSNWITWVNYPSTNSPIDEIALNKISNGLDTVDDRVVTFDTTKANQSDLLQAVKAVSFNSSTGTFVFTLFNNNTITIDTDIEKIAVNFTYDDDPTSAHYQCLVLTLSDGSIKYIDLSALITQYEFSDTSTIHANVGLTGDISFNVIDGSITLTKLDPSIQATIQAQIAAAENHALNSQAWAEGKKGSTPVTNQDPQYNNYSKYWNEQAYDKEGEAEAWAVGKKHGIDVPSTAPQYHNDAKYWAGQAAAAASGGHSIVDPSGTTMTQRSNLQFKGAVRLEDDSTDDTTKVIVEPDVNIFNVATTDWVANTDSSTSTRYPYKAVISTNLYSANMCPTWQMNGVGTLPTDAEAEEIEKIEDMIPSATALTLYATALPSVALKLQVAGTMPGSTAPTASMIPMTGYSEPASTSAISASDSVNDAIGKLEKKADNNSNAITTNTSAIANINDVNTYNIATTDWTANSDTTTNTQFPYIGTIITSDYASGDIPTWEVFGVNGIPTAAERTCIEMIQYGDFGADNGTKIILYATDQPTEALVLKAKGH